MDQRSILGLEEDLVEDKCRLLSTKEREARLEICQVCEHFENMVCKKCHCDLKRVTWYQSKVCPIGKW